MEIKKHSSRRQWLTGTVRWGLFAAMAGLSAHLLGRKEVIEEDACIDPKAHIGCRSCNQLRGCGLPRALSVKQFLKANEKQKS